MESKRIRGRGGFEVRGGKSERVGWLRRQPRAHEAASSGAAAGRGERGAHAAGARGARPPAAGAATDGPPSQGESLCWYRSPRRPAVVMESG
jgi:hypothetical protein